MDKLKRKSIGEKTTDIINWIENNWFDMLWIILIAGILLSSSGILLSSLRSLF